jgi:GNAT superfamily N-acetyltransferase
VFLLFVHPAYAGRGIGRSLLTAAHDAPRAAGCTEACAHLLLQIRTRVLNDELAEDFRRWYPAFVDAAASAEPELAA